jgi:hypothetical protein
MPDYRLEIVNRQPALERTVETLMTRSVFALDIETVEWWNRNREKVALIQFAYRAREEVKVIIVDTLADCDVAILRSPLESVEVVKAIHNAAFDATKLFAHYRIETAPIHDTMLAARQSGEKKCSLQAQAAAHLNIHLNKGAQRSDWSRRPLDLKQIDYAARDAFSTLLLYENQIRRNLAGRYLLKGKNQSLNQLDLPLGPSGGADSALPNRLQKSEEKAKSSSIDRNLSDLSAASSAILGIVSQLPNRYSPEQLSVSVGADRVGIAGWIVDRFLGRETDFDEETAKLVISDLCERRLMRMTEYRRLEATEQGFKIWKQLER